MVTQLPWRSMVQSHLIRDLGGFGKVDDPGTCFDSIKDDENRRSDYFMTSEEVRLLYPRPHLFESFRQVLFDILLSSSKELIKGLQDLGLCFDLLKRLLEFASRRLKKPI